MNGLGFATRLFTLRLPRPALFALACCAPSLAAATVASAQAASDTAGRIFVRVVHESATPIGGALVRSGLDSVRTSDEGVAVLLLPTGTHVVIASRIGFAADTLAVAVQAGRYTTVTLTLRELAAGLAAVVVTAARSTRRIEDEPLRVEALSHEEVEEKLLMTPGDITMMLNETSGLRVQTTSPSLGGANVRVQGLRGRYTQLLADGLPLYGGQAGGLGLLQIPPMDLGGVEIIKGVSSALHGASALGGVINLVSRAPGAERARELLVNSTTLGGTDAAVFISSERDESDLATDYTLLAGAHRQRRVDRDGDGWTDLPGYERIVLRPRAWLSAGSGRTTMLTAGFTGENRRGGTMGGAVAPDGLPFPEQLTTRRWDAGGVGNFPAGSGILGVRASATGQHHRHTFGSVIERDRHLTWMGEVSWSMARGGHSWVVGGALQHESLAAHDVAGFDYSFSIPGVFAQGTVEISPLASVTASARVDDHDEYGRFASPRVSVLLRPRRDAAWSLRVSSGAGFFAPSPFIEETEVIGLSPLLPLRNLVAERARSSSLDVGGSLGPVEVHATVFRSVIRHAVGLRRSPVDSSRVELVNSESPTRTSGAELLGRWAPEPLHLTLSYTWVRSLETDPETGRRRSAFAPAHQAGLVAMLESEGLGRAGVEVYYTGTQPLHNDAYRSASPAYVHVGALIERQFGFGRVFLNAENLLDVRQTSHDPLVRPGRGLGGRWTNDVWGPLDGRVANLGVRLGVS